MSKGSRNIDLNFTQMSTTNSVQCTEVMPSCDVCIEWQQSSTAQDALQQHHLGHTGACMHHTWILYRLNQSEEPHLGLTQKTFPVNCAKWGILHPDCCSTCSSSCRCSNSQCVTPGVTVQEEDIQHAYTHHLITSCVMTRHPVQQNAASYSGCRFISGNDSQWETEMSDALPSRLCWIGSASKGETATLRFMQETFNKILASCDAPCDCR